eukprot:1157467-Pelagomonas_calceolata.AAC.3
MVTVLGAQSDCGVRNSVCGLASLLLWVPSWTCMHECLRLGAPEASSSAAHIYMHTKLHSLHQRSTTLNARSFLFARKVLAVQRNEQTSKILLASPLPQQNFANSASKQNAWYCLGTCRTIQQESYEYSDPVTQFLEFLFVHYDFDGAQQQLKDCEEVIDNDFFLTACREEFVENARLFIFEVRLGEAGQESMPSNALERWVFYDMRTISRLSMYRLGSLSSKSTGWCKKVRKLESWAWNVEGRLAFGGAGYVWADVVGQPEAGHHISRQSAPLNTYGAVNQLKRFGQREHKLLLASCGSPADHARGVLVASCSKIGAQESGISHRIWNGLFSFVYLGTGNSQGSRMCSSKSQGSLAELQHAFVHGHWFSTPRHIPS